MRIFTFIPSRASHKKKWSYVDEMKDRYLARRTSFISLIYFILRRGAFHYFLATPVIEFLFSWRGKFCIDLFIALCIIKIFLRMIRFS
ncbi:hypothetical protein Peur_040823 [Populus x canadensis]|jgi:hypothetical protein